jgi:hypothetical protein
MSGFKFGVLLRICRSDQRKSKYRLESDFANASLAAGRRLSADDRQAAWPRVTATTARYAPSGAGLDLDRQRELGAAMVAAIEKTPPTAVSSS